MSLLNLFKKKKKKRIVHKERSAKKSGEKIERSSKRPVSKKKAGEIYRTLKEPHISEKSTQLSDEGKYVFKIYKNVNKDKAKKAIENLYGVRVRSVNIINVKPKKRMLRGIEGKRGGHKKAIVTLEKGERIEIMPH